MPFGTDGKNRKRMTLADVGIDPPGDRFAPRSGASPKFVLIVLLVVFVVLPGIILAVASLPSHYTPPSPAHVGPRSAPDQGEATGVTETRRTRRADR